MTIATYFCKNCHKSIDRNKNKINKSGNHFCSVKCRTEHALKIALEELIGNRYGNLIVLEYAGKDRFNRNVCLARCDCGNEIIKPISLLRSGKCRKCGKYCKAKDIDKEKTDLEIEQNEKNKRLTDNVKAFIRENNDNSKSYVGRISKAYRISRKEVLEILN